MKRIIGIVGEGPTDFLILKTAIDHITGEKNIYRRIQPEQDMRGEYGNGWKGVYRWCEENATHLSALFSGISPGMDLLIIQMDGDVSRKEKESHCLCKNTQCEKKGEQSPIDCRSVKDGTCPITLPCTDHDDSPTGCREHLEKLLNSLLDNNPDAVNLVITIPCDSSDAWIVAAFDKGLDNIESIEDPWNRIISLKKDYHGIRIPGHRKSTSVYTQFMSVLSENWSIVVSKCQSARAFEIAIREGISQR